MLTIFGGERERLAVWYTEGGTLWRYAALPASMLCLGKGSRLLYGLWGGGQAP